MPATPTIKSHVVARPADLRGQDLTRWTAYLQPRSDSGTLFHRPEWRQVLDVYRLRYIPLMALRGSQVVGVLPLVEQRSPLSGHQLVSMPWFDAAGIVADDAEARGALLSAALTAAECTRAHFIQLRQQQPIQLSPYVRTDKVLMRLELPDDAQALWKGLDPKVRNQVRKSEKTGVTVETGGSELLDDFYSVYSHNMRDLGSPSHARRFFAEVCRAFPRETTIAVARCNGKTVGGGMTLANGPCLEIPWASSLRAYNRHCVNHALYWTLLQRACAQGFQRFCFGRSSVDSGTYHFKEQWGAVGHPLNWYFMSHQAERAARAARPPADDRSLAVRLWRRLPLFVTRHLGPVFIAQIP